jgi:hypothetical protein
MGLIVRLVLLIGGAITGIFMAKDSYQYPIMSMMVGILLFTLVIAIVAYRAPLKIWLRSFLRLDHED